MNNWIWGMDLFYTNDLIDTINKIIICPKCRVSFPRKFENYKFCPNYGADMRKGGAKC